MITEEDPPASGATRVDQPGRSERASPATATGPPRPREATCQTGTSTREPGHERPRPRRSPRRPRPPTRTRPGRAAPDPAPAPEHRRVNTTRTASTRAAKRRSQPRTVPGGRPSRSAIPAMPATSRLRLPAPPRSPRPCPRAGAATTPAAAHASPDSRCTATAAARPAPRRPRPRTVRARARPHPASTPAHPGHANPPDRSRSSTPTGSVSTVSIAPPSATTRPSRSFRPRTTAGGPWPTPTRRSSRWRRRRTRSTRPARQHADLHAQRRRPRPYVVILSGGQHGSERSRIRRNGKLIAPSSDAAPPGDPA